MNDRQMRERLPRVIAAGAPLLFGLISVSVDRLSAHFLDWPESLHLRNKIIAVNLILSTVVSAAGGLFCRDRSRERIGDMLGAGVYGFVAHMIFVLLTCQVME